MIGHVLSGGGKSEKGHIGYLKSHFVLKDYLIYFSITLVFLFFIYFYINRLLVSSLYDVVFLLMIFILGADPYTFTVWGIYSSQKLEQSVSKFWI